MATVFINMLQTPKCFTTLEYQNHLRLSQVNYGVIINNILCNYINKNMQNIRSKQVSLIIIFYRYIS